MRVPAEYVILGPSLPAASLHEECDITSEADVSRQAILSFPLLVICAQKRLFPRRRSGKESSSHTAHPTPDFGMARLASWRMMDEVQRAAMG